MLRYFRINDPYRLIGLFVLLLSICLPLFIDAPGITLPELKNVVIGEKLNEGNRMYMDVVDNTAPLAAWFHESIDSVFGRSILARHIAAFVLIFLQGAYLGIMLIMRKAFNENTYIPSLLFCLFAVFSFDTLTLSSELVGLSFLLIAINNLFKEIEFREQRDETIFNLGLFISFASLFSFAYFLFLFWVMVILIFFTRTTTRRFLLFLFGFLLPHFLVLTIAFLSGSLSKMWEYFYLSNLSFDRRILMGPQGLLVLGAIPLLYFVVSVVMLQRESRFSKYQSQLLQIMFLWLGFSLIYLLFCKNLRPQNMIVFVPGLAFLLTHFFLFIRRRKFIEMNIWILFIGIVSISYLARYQKLDSVNYDRLLVGEKNTQFKNKRLLVLEDDITWFRENQLASPYLNWTLSQDILLHPEFYENVTEVHDALHSDPPDIILDRKNLLEPFFNLSPVLKERYRRQEEFYIKISK